MKRATKLAVFAASLTLGFAAQAAEPLDLVHGLYVPKAADCASASAAARVWYDGVGLSGNKASCVTTPISGKPDRYKQACREATMGAIAAPYWPEVDTTEIVVQRLSRQSFRWQDAEYRFCPSAAR